MSEQIEQQAETGLSLIKKYRNAFALAVGVLIGLAGLLNHGVFGYEVAEGMNDRAMYFGGALAMAGLLGMAFESFLEYRRDIERIRARNRVKEVQVEHGQEPTGGAPTEIGVVRNRRAK